MTTISTTPMKDFDFVEIETKVDFFQKQRDCCREQIGRITSNKDLAQLTVVQKRNIARELQEFFKDDELFMDCCWNCCGYLSGYDIDNYFFKCDGETEHVFCSECFGLLDLKVKNANIDDDTYEDYDEYLVVNCPLCI